MSPVDCSRNGSRPDSTDRLRDFLRAADPAIRKAISEAIRLAKKSGRPLGFAHLAQALLANVEVTARLPRRVANKAAALLKASAPRWEAAAQNASFDLVRLVESLPARKRYGPTSFFAAALKSPVLDDELSRNVVRLLRRLQVDAASLTRKLRLPGDDMIAEAKCGKTFEPSPVETERLHRLFGVLAKKLPVLVIGEGKTRFLRRFAHSLAANHAFAAGARWKPLRLTRSHLLGKARGDNLDACFARLFERASADANRILVFEDVHEVLGDSNAGPPFAAALKGAIDAGRLSIILVASASGYARHLRPDDSLHRGLTVISLSALPPE
jgi:ATP-dependent Clp protease ATP-binding subunit ClpA